MKKILKCTGKVKESEQTGQREQSLATVMDQIVTFVENIKQQAAGKGKGNSYQGRVAVVESGVEGESATIGANGISQVESDLYTGRTEQFASFRVTDDEYLLRTRQGEQPGSAKYHQCYR